MRVHAFVCAHVEMLFSHLHLSKSFSSLLFSCSADPILSMAGQLRILLAFLLIGAVCAGTY